MRRGSATDARNGPPIGLPPTTRQAAVLRVLVDRIDRDGVAPSFREIGEAIGIRSTHGVACHLVALERRGLVESERFKSRTHRPTERGRALVGKGLTDSERIARAREVLGPLLAQRPTGLQAKLDLLALGREIGKSLGVLVDPNWPLL